MARTRVTPPRAARLLADWAFDVAGVARLVAGTAPDNIGSQRVLEKARASPAKATSERGCPDRAAARVDNVAYALLPGDRSVHPPPA